MSALLIIATACIAYAWHRERVRRAKVEEALARAQTKLSAGGRARACKARDESAALVRATTAQLQRELGRVR